MSSLYAPVSRLITATFTRDGSGSDPDEVLVFAGAEGQEADRLEFGVDDDVVHVAAGVYRVEVDCTAAGWWAARVQGTWDDGINAPSYRTYEERWYVRRSHLTLPDEGS